MLNEEYGVRAGTDYDLSGHPWNAVGLPRDPFECDFSSNDAYIGLETGWSSVVGYFRRAGSSCTWTSDGVTSTNGCLCKELAGHRARPRQPFTLHRQCIWSLVPNIRPRARVGGWVGGGGVSHETRALLRRDNPSLQDHVPTVPGQEITSFTRTELRIDIAGCFPWN